MIKKIAIITGLLLLTALGVFINLSIGNTTNEQTSYSATNANIQPVHKQAAEITKSECNPKMWEHWDKNTHPVNETTIGVAPVLTSQNGNKITVETNLYIHKDLTDPEQITHTAWHECAHAKTYIVNNQEVQELHNRAQIAFADCEYGFIECLADAMTEVKNPGTQAHYYQQEFTQEQLDIAERVWKASGKAQAKQKITGNAWLLLNY